MKKTVWILIMLLAFAPAWAQKEKTGQRAGKEELLNRKLAYLREKLLLSDREFKAFEKAYKAYEMQRWKLFEQKKKILKDLKVKNSVKLSDVEVEKRLEQILDTEEKMFRLKKDFYNRLKKILPPRKTLEFFREDMRYNRMLLRKKRKMMREKAWHGSRPAPYGRKRHVPVQR